MLRSAVAELARGRLQQTAPFGDMPESDLDLVAAFLALPEPENRCLQCGRLLSGRARKWCPGDVCRKRFEREEQMRFSVLGATPNSH